MSGGNGSDRAVGQDERTDDLVRTAFTVMAVLTRIGAAYDLSLTQLRVFGILRDRRPRMAQLARFLGLEKSTMSGLITRAERRGLIERVPSTEDGRASDVVLTPEGQAIARQVHRQVREALAPMTDRLNESEWVMLHSFLARMAETALPPDQRGPDSPA